MKSIKIIQNVAECILQITDREMVRLDIQKYDVGYGYTGYVGYLDTDTISYRIRQDGSFEQLEK